MKKKKRRDKCQVCKGAHGGAPGNENISCGVLICDYCYVVTMGNDAIAVDARTALAAGDLPGVLQQVLAYQVQCRANRGRRP